MVITDVPQLAGSSVELVELKHKRRESALAQLVAAAERIGAARDAEILLGTLVRAVRLGADACGRGFAIVHARSLAVTHAAILIGRTSRGVEWRAGEEPAQLVVLVLAPATMSAALHVERLAAIAHALRLQRVRQRVLEVDPSGVAVLFAGTEA